MALTSRRRSSANLPGGMVPVAAGLVVLGATSYGFLVLAARSLGPERYAPLSVLWALVFLVGPGVFVPLEQELARAIAARQATGRGAEDLVRKAGLAGVAMLELGSGRVGPEEVGRLLGETFVRSFAAPPDPAKG